MTRKRARHLMMELSRQCHFKYHGTYKGWGKSVHNHYNDKWKPAGIENAYFTSYAEIFTLDPFKSLIEYTGVNFKGV